MRKAMRVLTAVLLIAVLLIMPVSVQANSNIAAQSRNGVVRIYSSEARSAYYSSGSGVAVGIAGESTDIFVTNRHVVEDADEIYILLDNDWRHSIPSLGGEDDSLHAVRCEVIYVHPNNADYAILRACRVVTERVALPLMPAQMAYPGDTVFALGYPAVADNVTHEPDADIDAMTITRGTISRFVTLESKRSKVIQIDADINRGNSGGPLITEEGYVIGLNTWLVGDEDGQVNLALEIDYVIDKLNELVADGTLPGFEFTVISDRYAVPGETTPTETEPVITEDEKSIPSLLWIVLAVAGVALIVVFFIRSRVIRGQQQPSPAQPAMDMPQPVMDMSSPPMQPTQPQPAPAAPMAEAPGYERTVSVESLRNPESGSNGIEFRLVGLEGQFAGRRIALDKQIHLGRHPQNDLVYPAGTPGISSNHCVLAPRGSCVLLMDQGSTYGTYLGNGTKLTPNKSVSLIVGDVFYLGDKRQMFRIERKMY